MKTLINKGVRAIRMTANQVKQDEAREYNSQVWESNVDMMLKYKDVQFYKVEKGNGYDYSRFFVVYTLEDGLRLMNTFSYSSAITNGGFYRAFVNDMEVYMDEKNNLEVITLTDDKIRLETSKVTFRDENGGLKEGAIGNDKKARAYMTEQSLKNGSVWTKCYLG